jgi:hypothetical protein
MRHELSDTEVDPRIRDVIAKLGIVAGVDQLRLWHVALPVVDSRDAGLDVIQDLRDDQSR